MLGLKGLNAVTSLSMSLIPLINRSVSKLAFLKLIRYAVTEFIT